MIIANCVAQNQNNSNTCEWEFQPSALSLQYLTHTFHHHRFQILSSSRTTRLFQFCSGTLFVSLGKSIKETIGQTVFIAVGVTALQSWIIRVMSKLEPRLLQPRLAKLIQYFYCLNHRPNDSTGITGPMTALAVLSLGLSPQAQWQHWHRNSK